MSTQNTASWCLFHELCKYCARRGTFKSRFLKVFVPESSDRKNTVSLPRILASKYQSIVDDRIRVKRTSNMVNKMEESARNDNSVLQWRINRIASWMSLRSSEIIIPDSSVQYWNLLFAPPAAKHAFHRLWDQWTDCGNRFCRFSFILQKWSAPSSSRCTCWEWRRRWFTFFEISYAERKCYPCSMSIQFLLSMEMIFDEEPVSSLLCGFAFAFVWRQYFRIQL